MFHMYQKSISMCTKGDSKAGGYPKEHNLVVGLKLFYMHIMRNFLFIVSTVPEIRK